MSMAGNHTWRWSRGLYQGLVLLAALGLHTPATMAQRNPTIVKANVLQDGYSNCSYQESLYSVTFRFSITFANAQLQMNGRNFYSRALLV
ncbi:hypothetical protein KDH83_31070, partial [Achromobacter sp. Marseille-Q0513]|uniref:hypothetical protein n=1 Tax=Achromobacter sp. Marseille-Q0513 TaxID=2829161 RepID=UPI001B920748